MHKCICGNNLVCLIQKTKELKEYQASCHKCGRKGPWNKRSKAIEQWNLDMIKLWVKI